MVIGNKKTHIAYRCPRCGGGVIGIAADFALTGNRLLKLKCPCGESEMTVTAENEKIRVTVPCLLCADNHSFLLSPALFFEKNLFLLNCPYSNLDVGFIGEESAVSRALEENETTLKKLFADAGIEMLTTKAKEEEDLPLPDVGALDVIRFLVKDLEEEGKIDCPCHNGEYDVEFSDGGIRVFCKNCEAECLFPVFSREAAEAFLQTDEILLREKD